MAESLRRLTNIASFTILQEKLERWLDDYHVNSCDQNVLRCCEVIELNARVQSQLFKLLALSSSEGGVYGGASVIKSRLLPWLGHSMLAGSGSGMVELAGVAEKDREMNELQEAYERSMTSLEVEMRQTRVEADELKHELVETRDELQATKRQSSSDKMFTESEVREQRNKVELLEDEISRLRGRSHLVDSYEHQVRNLREDVAMLTSRRDVLINGETSVKPLRSLSRASSPFAVDDVTQRVRQQNLIARFNDLFSQDRLDAMDTLRVYSDDNDNNEKVVFAVIQAAFSHARLAFASFKVKVRSNVASTHLGPETLEEAVQDYINRNSDLYDLPTLVSDVLRALARDPTLFLPAEAAFSVVQPLVREACKLAWGMTALAHPLDIAVASDAELFEDSKYRRSYNSEYTAPLVDHHVWPCLVQGLRVIMKGEACTRRGAGLSPYRRSRSPRRSASPARAVSPSRSPLRLRSRSPSPRRIDSGFSGRSSPGFRAYSSRASSSPSRAVTASTSLSHYGVKC